MVAARNRPNVPHFMEVGTDDRLWRYDYLPHAMVSTSRRVDRGRVKYYESLPVAEIRTGEVERVVLLLRATPDVIGVFPVRPEQYSNRIDNYRTYVAAAKEIVRLIPRSDDVVVHRIASGGWRELGRIDRTSSPITVGEKFSSLSAEVNLGYVFNIAGFTN